MSPAGGGASAPPAAAGGPDQGAVEAGADEGRLRIDGGADAIIAEVEGIADARGDAGLEVHPLQRLAAGVEQGVRITHAADDRRRPLNARGAAVDRELPLAVEDDEHLLHGVVKVVADAAARGNLAAVQEIEVRPNRAPVEQPGERHVAGAGVHGGQRSILGRIGGHDARRQWRRLRRRVSGRQCHRERRRGQSGA